MKARPEEHHGMRRSAEYSVWMDMRTRCGNPRDKDYKNYGARGISVCKRWAESFIAFFSDMGPRPEGMTLDRIDVNGNYEPGNCRWIDRKTQVRNRRNALLVFYGQRELPLMEACELAGVKYNTALYRLLQGRDWLTGVAPTTAAKAED